MRRSVRKSLCKCTNYFLKMHKVTGNNLFLNPVGVGRYLSFPRAVIVIFFVFLFFAFSTFHNRKKIDHPKEFSIITEILVNS